MGTTWGSSDQDPHAILQMEKEKGCSELRLVSTGKVCRWESDPLTTTKSASAHVTFSPSTRTMCSCHPSLGDSGDCKVNLVFTPPSPAQGAAVLTSTKTMMTSISWVYRYAISCIPAPLSLKMRIVVVRVGLHCLNAVNDVGRRRRRRPLG